MKAHAYARRVEPDGPTLSDKTARKEFGLTQAEIEAAIDTGQLQHAGTRFPGSRWLNSNGQQEHPGRISMNPQVPSPAEEWVCRRPLTLGKCDRNHPCRLGQRARTARVDTESAFASSLSTS
jgi:hypothetical protein